MSTLEAPPDTFATRGGAALAAIPERRGAPRPRPEERPRHLRVVAPTERVRRRLTPATGVLLTGLLFVTLFAIATAHTILVQGQIHLDRLDDQLSVEQARYQELRKDVAEMESPSRVVAAAQDLGMVSPDDLVYLQPDAGTPASEPVVVGDPGTGSATRTDGAGDGQDLASVADHDWAVMKPLLEAPAP